MPEPTLVTREALDRSVRIAIARLRRSVPASLRGPYGVHVLKRRARRRSAFHGACDPVPGGMRVRWGLVIKEAAPHRIAELRDRHAVVERTLARGGALPRAPRVLAADPAAGWMALEAWPGVPLAAMADPDARARALCEVAARVAALEQVPARDWVPRPWSGPGEARRLREVWEGAGAPVPEEGAALAEWLAAQAATVPAHRDLYAEQVIVDGDSADRWIDWDEAALAPPGLDLGNLLAHEPAGSEAAAGAARRAYREAGGRATERALAAWEAAACLRLAGLALQRSRGDDPVERNAGWIAPPATTIDAVERWRSRARALLASAACGLLR